ncbi:CDGSH iron-sulfur domain-containing protein [Streptomyces sp. IBSBF 2953]|nr:CDGSH iron-sulfur domain-containing protein [Streptomyces hayashii]
MSVQRFGPLLVEGPVEVELEDGTTVASDRFRVALCTCRRSRRYPWCDTSHRDRERKPSRTQRPGTGSSGPGAQAG